jgi:hypothetical protein
MMLGYGGPGVWAGLTVGLMVTAGGLVGRLRRMLKAECAST